MFMDERQGPDFLIQIFIIFLIQKAACNQEMTTRDIYLRKYNYILLTAVQHESMKYDIHLKCFFYSPEKYVFKNGTPSF